jgi:hypothetical protein
VGLFNRSSTSSQTNIAFTDDRDVTDQSGLTGIVGNGNSQTSIVNVTDGGAIEAGRAMVEEGNDTVRLLAQMNADSTLAMGEAIVTAADNAGSYATRVIEGQMRQQGTFLDRVFDITKNTQSSAQEVLNQAMTTAAAANTPADERQQKNILIGLGLVAAVMVAVAYFGKR